MKIKVLGVVCFLSLLLASGAYAQNLYYLPQVANGSFGAFSFRTTFVIFNNSDANVTVVLTLTDDNGAPMVVTINGLGSNSQFNITLGAGATNMLQTDGLGKGAAGAAKVNATAPIGVSAIFTIYDAAGNYLTEAGVGSSAPSTDFVLPVDSTGFFLTGLALFNPTAVDATITMTLLNTDGSQKGTVTLLLLRGTHSASYVAAAGQLFPTVSNFRGTLVVQSSAAIAAVGLRQYQDPSTGQLTFTSLPVVPRSSGKLALNIAQVVNGSYNGTGFKTSFLIFNISLSTANVTLTLTKDDGTPLVVTISGSGTSGSFSIILAAGASVFLQTDGLGAEAAGAATITSNVPIGAAAIFTEFNQGKFQTEAGVGDSSVLTQFTLPVDINGTSDTGVAFFNPGISTQTLNFKLLNTSGVIVGTTTRSNFAAKNHLAVFVSELFPGTTNFKGSLGVSTLTGVAATTLRQYLSGANYTTLPATSGEAVNGTQPALLSKMESGIPATTNVTVNETLPGGFKLSGAISGSGTASSVIASAGANNFFTGAINQVTGTYVVLVPQGTYTLQVYFKPNGAPVNEFLTMTYTDPSSVVVGGDTTRNEALPSVTLFNVSGKISGLPSAVGSPAVIFTNNDNTISGRCPLDTSGNYQGALPAGDYLTNVNGVNIQFGYAAPGFYNLGPLHMGGSAVIANYTVSSANLTGTIRAASLSTMPASTTVNATDTLAPTPSQFACCAPPITSYGPMDSTGNYGLIPLLNRSYVVKVTVPLLSGTVFFPVDPAAGTVNVAGNTTFDFNLPGFPVQVTISGRVTDSSGGGVSNTYVFVTSQSITGAPNLGFSGSTKTDANGYYSVAVPSGNNYQLNFVPPAIKP